MPFEFGLTLGVCGVRTHSFVVLEARRGRLASSLSDLNGYDCVELHGNTVRGVLQALSANLLISRRHIPFGTLVACYRALRRTAGELQRVTGARSIYSPRMFTGLAAAGALHARRITTRP